MRTIVPLQKIDKPLNVVPYRQDSATKKEQVAKMFNTISPKYDFLNHFLSLGIDILWRKKAIRSLKNDNPKLILDVATGTGDFAIEALALHPDKVIGVDISTGMLEIGKNKMAEKGYTQIELMEADSENLPFEENKFDAAIVAFGVRNFENLEKGLKEILRVLKPGGKLVVLEFSKPRTFPFKQLYTFYFKMILPKIGKWFSHDASAYTYLPDSVQAFPDGQDFVAILSVVGYKNSTCRPLTFGISSLYTASK